MTSVTAFLLVLFYIGLWSCVALFTVVPWVIGIGCMASHWLGV